MFAISSRCDEHLGRYITVSVYIPIVRKSSVYRELGEYAFDVSAAYATRGMAKSLPVDKSFYW